MYEDFKHNKISEKKILEEIQANHLRILRDFDKQFKEKFADGEDIKFLKR